MEQMEQPMETTQTTKKSGKKKTIIIGVIIFLLLGGLFTAFESDPCSKAEAIAEEEYGFRVMDSKIIAEQEDASVVAVDCEYNGVRTAVSVFISYEADDHILYFCGIEMDSGETIGYMYDDIPEMETMEDALTQSAVYHNLIELQLRNAGYL